MSFILIRDIRDLAIRDLANGKLPSVTPGSHDILIDLAAAHQLNITLTTKQLLLMRGGSATTLRRRLQLLVDAGYIRKIPNQRDARSNHYSVTDQFMSACTGMDEQLQKISEMFERRCTKRRASDPEPPGRRSAL